MAVNWIDKVAQGDPETVVSLPTGALVGLHIRGLGPGHVMLGIREDRLGRPVSCAVTNELHIEYPPMQSGPKRHQDESDYFSDEDGA